MALNAIGTQTTTNLRYVFPGGLLPSVTAIENSLAAATRLRITGRDGEEAGLDALARAPARGEVAAIAVTGTGVAERELSVPYRGDRLRGDALLRRLDAWVTDGVIEPSCADAVRAVAAESDLVLVAGSANSSNSVRLVETCERAGTPAHLIDSAADIELDWLTGPGWT